MTAVLQVESVGATQDLWRLFYNGSWAVSEGNHLGQSTPGSTFWPKPGKA